MESFEQAEHFSMNTVFSHRVFGARAAEALEAVRAEAARLEGLLSRFLPDSDVSRLNGRAGQGPQAVGPDAFEVLLRAVDCSRRCDGLFDVTVAPLVDLWRQAGKTGDVPEESAVRRALQLVGWRSLRLNEAECTVELERPGQAVDLGGIGKGYAADRFLELFRSFRVASAFTNLGGNVAALGGKPDGSPWRVGIRHPRAEGALVGLVEVRNASVVTSGDDQRYFTDRSGAHRHHLLDPGSGWPAESGLLSVSVVAASSMDADALSTALFVAGLARGLELLGRFPGAEAVFVDKDLRVTVTAGLSGRFQAAEGISFKILD